MIDPGSIKLPFEVEIGSNAPSSLEAHRFLTATTAEGLFHHSRSLRMPLGIYNVSISRISNKITRLCQCLEVYFKAAKNLESLKNNNEVMQEIINYIELMLYSAAEHVDDIELIAGGFFEKPKANNEFKSLQKRIDLHKRYVSAAANAIKHRQSRIRMFSLEFSLLENFGCLHGYFIEGVENGTLGPSKTFHQTQNVFSITTLIWETILFLLNSSRELTFFLKNTTPLATPTNNQCDVFQKAVIAAARLPLYTFGEVHPFSHSPIRITLSDDKKEILDSGILGSINKAWPKVAPFFGSCRAEYEGDNQTKHFRIIQPKTIGLSYWS